MTDTRPRGDRATGTVPPFVLIVGGLLIALVAVTVLVLQLRGAGTGSSSHPVNTSTTSATSRVVPPDTSSSSSTGSGTSGTDAADDGQDDPVGEAAWIKIASAGVDGELEPQGLAPDGTINPGRGQIIWFTGYDRVSPGRVGTSVIAGHVTWEGAQDVFARLPEVSVGDRVEVGYADGSTRTFTVTETGPVDKDELTHSMTVWGPQPDVPRLAIITCDEAQGYQANGHTKANFVVIAEG